MSPFKEYEDYDGLGLAELVKNHEVTPEELLNEASRRIDELNPILNAVVYRADDLAIRACREGLPPGPFQGVPFLLKDLRSSCRGMPLSNGCRFRAGFVPDVDSELVARYRRAGLVFVGKTNVPELGLMPVTEPELFGVCRNPWGTAYTPGGSSGGSAAAVTARIVPLAHGSDGAGSIRIPASCCGLFGLKPTRGRNPMGPGRQLFYSAEHVLTRSVRDSAAMLDATAGPGIGALYYAPSPERSFLSESAQDPPVLKIAFTSDPFLPSEIHEDCLEALQDAVELCRDLGHELIEIQPELDPSALAGLFLTLVFAETRADIREMELALGRTANHRDFEPLTWVINLLGRYTSSLDYLRAMHELEKCAAYLGGFFRDYDVLLTPTLALPPVEVGSMKPAGLTLNAMKLLGRLNAGGILKSLTDIDELAGEVFRFIPFTPPFNFTGQPAMSVPLYWNRQGLPIGVQFVGRYGDEATLFRLAGQLERARPWAHRKPSFIEAKTPDKKPVKLPS